MQTEELIHYVGTQSAAPWSGEAELVEERKRYEIALHDQKRDADYLASLSTPEQETLLGDRKFYAAAVDFSKYCRDWIRTHAPGKAVLDYACGNGGHSITAAQAGAAVVVGIDISGVSVANAARAARTACPESKTYFLQRDCENTGFPDSSFDVIICSGMLHHIDLSYAFPELRRILKPGGIVFGAEALRYNPIIALYRKLTPRMRTKWEAEHILSYRELRFAKHFFDVKNVRHFTLLSLFGFYVPTALPGLCIVDRIILSIPLLKLMSWMFTFELHKRVVR